MCFTTTPLRACPGDACPGVLQPSCLPPGEAQEPHSRNREGMLTPWMLTPRRRGCELPEHKAPHHQKRFGLFRHRLQRQWGRERGNQDK